MKVKKSLNQKSLKQKFVIIIYGPTAVGKSDFAEKLAANLQQAQIVNCDLGQFYTELSIGVAKPDYKSSEIKQHLFDIIDEPEDFNVSQYRKLVFNKINEIWDENDVPILVGGSGFYLKSLFFPPLAITESDQIASQVSGCTDAVFFAENSACEKIASSAREFAEGVRQDFDSTCLDNICDKDLWDTLYKIDPERAKKIDKNDVYRLRRALELWEKTGRKPSELAPVFDFPSNFLLIFLNRDRQELYTGIDARTDQMMQAGWIDEVEKLIGKEDGESWEKFLKNKKLIGYDLIIDYVRNNLNMLVCAGSNCNTKSKKLGVEKDPEICALVENIKQKTKNYAKRQITFWRSLEKQLKKEVEKNKYTNKVDTRVGNKFGTKVETKIEEFNLNNNKKIEESLYTKNLLAYLAPLFD